jgi:hypothetical protein
MGSVRCANANETAPTRFDDIGHAKLPTNLDHFSAGEDDITALPEDSHGQKCRRGIVVHNGGSFGIS